MQRILAYLHQILSSTATKSCASSPSDEYKLKVIYYYPYFDIPPAHWPQCDLFVSFHSTDHPLDAVKHFVDKHFAGMFVVNDIDMQKVLLDRQLVQEVLRVSEVPTADKHVVIIPDADRYATEIRFGEEVVGRKLAAGFDVSLRRQGDALIWQYPHTHCRSEVRQDGDKLVRLSDGKVLARKPWVEKPRNSEDHNIWVYYPSAGLSMPGLADNGLRGGRKLFRKQGDKSSEYDETMEDIRSDAAYVYEPLQEVDGWEDVKVYCIGPHYAYAEARKSPLVDGIVTRDAAGKELRRITPLTAEEITIAERVSLAFGQFVCGFDVLRVADRRSKSGAFRSMVVDVNGWTFVKAREDFFKATAEHLARLVRLLRGSIYDAIADDRSRPVVQSICFFRHADRNPKQKIRLTEPAIVDAARRHFPAKHVLKSTQDLQMLASLFSANKHSWNASPDVSFVEKLELPSAKVLIKHDSLVLKWGGELTHHGRTQSIATGRHLADLLKRQAVPSTSGASVRAYCGHESRVAGTADLVLRSMLSLTHLPRRMLSLLSDDTSNAKEAKSHLNPLIPSSVTRQLAYISDCCHLSRQDSDEDQCRESWSAFVERWKGLCADIRISDLYDALKYDLRHHLDWLHRLILLPPRREFIFWWTLFEEVRRTYVEQIGPYELGPDPHAMSLSILSPIMPVLHAVLPPSFVKCPTNNKSRPSSDILLAVFTKEAQMQSIVHLISDGYKNYPWQELDYLCHLRLELRHHHHHQSCHRCVGECEVEVWRSRGARVLSNPSQAGSEYTEQGDLAPEVLIERMSMNELLRRLYS